MTFDTFDQSDEETWPDPPKLIFFWKMDNTKIKLIIKPVNKDKRANLQFFWSSAVYQLSNWRKKFWSIKVCCWHLGDGKREATYFWMLNISLTRTRKRREGKSTRLSEKNLFLLKILQHFQTNVLLPLIKKHFVPNPGSWSMSVSVINVGIQNASK